MFPVHQFLIKSEYIDIHWYFFYVFACLARGLKGPNAKLIFQLSFHHSSFKIFILFFSRNAGIHVEIHDDYIFNFDISIMFFNIYTQNRLTSKLRYVQFYIVFWTVMYWPNYDKMNRKMLASKFYHFPNTNFATVFCFIFSYWEIFYDQPYKWVLFIYIIGTSKDKSKVFLIKKKTFCGK